MSSTSSRQKIVQLLNRFFSHRPSREDLMKRNILHEDAGCFHLCNKKDKSRPKRENTAQRVRKLSKCAATVPMFEQVSHHVSGGVNDNNGGSTYRATNYGEDKEHTNPQYINNKTNTGSNEKQYKYTLNCHPRNGGNLSSSPPDCWRSASTGKIVAPAYLRPNSPSNLRSEQARRSTSPLPPTRTIATPYFDLMMTNVDWTEESVN